MSTALESMEPTPTPTPTAAPAPAKRKFTFPTAYTILFLLIVLVALATWFIPAGRYDYTEDGAPIPGTYHPVESNPQKLLYSAVMGPINGMYGIEDETGNQSAGWPGSARPLAR